MKYAIAARIRLLGNEFWPVALVALLAWVSIVVCLDPAGSYPSLPEGPGLTVDEVFNVSQGVLLVEQARALGWLNLIPATSQEAYRPENGYNPDHPPLGRWWLGIHHHLMWWLCPPFEPEKNSFVIACARTGSASAFALTVLMIGVFASIWFGRVVGVMSAISLVLMPRVYGHAHLASLETVTNLTCTAAVLSVAHWWNGPLAPGRKVAILTGLLFGLALVTKIQAVLIPVPLLCWALWRWRAQAVVPLALWGVAAFFVFFVSWPYLWFDSFNHVLEYLGRTTNRATLQVWYLGEKYPDKLVPWHYSFVMFGLTVPVVLQGLGLLGVLRSCLGGRWFFAGDLLAGGNCAVASLEMWEKTPHPGSLPARPGRGDQMGLTSLSVSSAEKGGNSVCLIGGRELLLLACCLFPLVVFALPGVAVYDGERLFLTSFPLWAVFVGRGWGALCQIVTRFKNSRALAATVCVLLLAESGSPLVTMAPCHLCYYNEVVSYCMGGVDRAGLEVDYWGEGITRQLLQQLADNVPVGATVAVVPTLHQFQADDYRRQSPILRSHGIKIVEYQNAAKAQEFVLIFRRRADLPEQWNRIKPKESQQQALGTTLVKGRLLAYFVRRE